MLSTTAPTKLFDHLRELMARTVQWDARVYEIRLTEADITRLRLSCPIGGVVYIHKIEQRLFDFIRTPIRESTYSSYDVGYLECVSINTPIDEVESALKSAKEARARKWSQSATMTELPFGMRET